jgi:hypothetical protein
MQGVQQADLVVQAVTGMKTQQNEREGSWA